MSVFPPGRDSQNVVVRSNVGVPSGPDVTLVASAPLLLVSTAAVHSLSGSHSKLKTSHPGLAVRRMFEPQELCAIREDALREYLRMKMADELSDVERMEADARERLVEQALFFFEALATRNVEKCKKLARGRELLYFIERLKDREAIEDQRRYALEEALREEGRAEWRREVEEKAAYGEYLRAFEEWKREQENTVRAACAFVMGTEVRYRRGVVAEESDAWEELWRKEREEREEAERIAYENFYNSPEQVILREERERVEGKLRQKYERQMVRHLKEQEQIVKSCKHGRGNTSIFEGPKASKKCASCGVSFDKDLGYYVRSYGKTIPPPPPLPESMLDSAKPKFAASHMPGTQSGVQPTPVPPPTSEGKLPPIGKKR
ncbi:hypothetical protein, conserved [Trypanosoma brucei brucei TREU927]|uniref:Uncharacterized protein n=1 Tax=Trypanosoma brucei brucei (strain 927/4 GUTat10.1) TaxID=185431 RepID=Q38FM0_TRYB2|nr:hypothetical protein, conserved [Trypanosoma brucei brucei TREU927]EAN76400.1 hypothetical protein, conserved [Trypanosoma brucei brucei TREU927]